MAAEDIMPGELNKATALLEEIRTHADKTCSHITNLIDKVENEEISTEKGVSFLEVKYQLLLEYLINLTHIINLKVRGKSIQDEGSVDRLVEVRTVLEKIRPIDQKLKYQIDKLIKTTITGIVGENDPLRLKPNPAGLVSKLEESGSDDASSDDEDGDGNEGNKKTTSKIYRPPKLAPVHYDGDVTMNKQKEKLVERRKKRMLSSNIMKELKEEIGDSPMEIRESFDLHRARDDKKSKERTEYEEKYFMRMQLSKKEMNESKKLLTRERVNDITKFGDIRALTGGEDDDLQGGAKKKKRKMNAGKSKKGKKKKIRRF